MKLPLASSEYSTSDQATLRREIERADRENLKRGRDIEIQPATGSGATAQPAQRLIFTDTVTGARWSLTIAAGVLTPVAL